MQIQSIGANPQFASRKHSRENIDSFIELDDYSVRQIAAAKTLAVTEDRKHKRIADAMFYSVPVVAGITTAVLTKGKSEFLGKAVTGMAAKFANGLKSAGYWAGLLLGVDIVAKARNKATQKSEKVRKFEGQYPFVSFMATLGAALGVIALGGKGINYLAKKVKPATVAKIQSKVGKAATKLNNNKMLKSLSKAGNKFTSKLNPTVKQIGKTAIAWAPDMMLLGGIVHSVNHTLKRNAEFVKNYNEIKDKQFTLAQARMNEMKEWQEETV